MANQTPSEAKQEKETEEWFKLLDDSSKIQEYMDLHAAYLDAENELERVQRVAREIEVLAQEI